MLYFVRYLALFILTLLALLLWPAGGIKVSHWLSGLLEYGKKLKSINIFRDGTKEKDEDLNCEYDMIWDAEGSMHLVKRPLNTPNTGSSETNSYERCAYDF